MTVGGPGYVHIGFGDVDVAMRADDRHRATGLAERVALAAHRDRDARDVRERDIGEEGDVHAGSVGARD